MKLYDYLPSGNSYKVRLLLSWLGQDYTHMPIDIHAEDTRTDTFLTMNPTGQIPVLELDDGRVLAESNAILFYLAQNSRYWPDDVFEQALCLRWMFFEQYKHEPNIAVARYIHHYAPERKTELPGLLIKGHQALEVMETHLADRHYFAGNRVSIADIALYAYTHVADEGGFDLAPYIAINAWLKRITSHPKHIPITKAP